MKIVVFADSHGKAAAVEKLYNLHSDADRYFFLGDGVLDVLKSSIPKNKLVVVSGNWDFPPPPNVPLLDYCEVGGVYFSLCHGHKFDVKNNLHALSEHAKENNVDIALYGHTHIQKESVDNGVRLINPGSIGGKVDGKLKYALIHIQEGQALVSLTAI